MALLALLALSRRHECSRVWLQQMLWSASDTRQAQSSLRRELSTLRSVLGETGIIHADHRVVRLDRERVWIDIFASDYEPEGGLLEGVDLPHEEEFEDWLRTARATHGDCRAAEAATSQGAAPLASPASVHEQVSPAIERDWRPTVILESTSRAGSHGADKNEAAIDHALAASLSHQQMIKVVWGNETENGSCGYLIRSVVAAGAEQSELHIALLSRADYSLICSSQMSIDPARSLPEQLLVVANSIPYVVDKDVAVSGPVGAIGTKIAQVRTSLNSCTLRGLKRARKLLVELQHAPEARSELALLDLQWRVMRAWMGARLPATMFDHLSARAQWLAREHPLEARAPMLAGIVDMITGSYEAASHRLKLALELNPSCALANALGGAILGAQGHIEEGLAAIDRALTLAIHDPYRFLMLGERDALLRRHLGAHGTGTGIRLLRTARLCEFDGPASRALMA